MSSTLLFGGCMTAAMLGTSKNFVRQVQVKSNRCLSSKASKRFHKSGIIISSAFDSGNIVVINADNPKDIRLQLREESFTEFDGKAHKQWFHFQVCNAKQKELNLRILNAGKASYAEAYEGYWAFISYDRENWFRTKTVYEEGVLEINITPEKDTFWVSYFPPYSYEQHLNLIALACKSPLVEYMALGYSIQGRPIDCLKTGTGSTKCWIIARQHPGETQAEWWMDGFISELLGDSASAQQVRKECTLYIVPSMNPDGAIMGHLRTNAVGANLNREWTTTVEKNYEAPLIDRSPEVYHVLDKMDETGVDFFLDVHGDEELPCCFLANAAGIPNWTPRLEYLNEMLANTMLQVCKPYFQVELGYGNDEPGEAMLAIASDQVSNTFDCLGTTLEMPYKDLAYPINKKFDHVDCQKFGAQMVNVIENMAPYINRNFLENDIPKDCKVNAWSKPGYKCPEWKQPTY